MSCLVEEPRDRGVGTIRNLSENPDAQRLWQAQRFEGDMACMSLYASGRATMTAMSNPHTDGPRPPDSDPDGYVLIVAQTE
jgi:hypothetical protein